MGSGASHSWPTCAPASDRPSVTLLVGEQRAPRSSTSSLARTHRDAQRRGRARRRRGRASRRAGRAPLGRDVGDPAADQLGVRRRLRDLVRLPARAACAVPVSHAVAARCRATPGRRRRRGARRATAAISSANTGLVLRVNGSASVIENVSGRGVTCGHTSRALGPALAVAARRALRWLPVGRREQRGVRERHADPRLQLVDVGDSALSRRA